MDELVWRKIVNNAELVTKVMNSAVLPALLLSEQCEILDIYQRETDETGTISWRAAGEFGGLNVCA